MKRRTLPLSLTLILFGTIASAQDMLGVTWSGAVYSIDSTNGASVLVGNTGLGSGTNSMAVDSQGTIYCFQRIGTLGNYQSQLITLDPTTGFGTPIHSPINEDVRGAAFDPISGHLFLVTDHASNASGSDELAVYDLGTQSIAVIGPTGDINLQSLAITPNGSIYTYAMAGANNDRLATLDRTTGTMTVISPSAQPSLSTIQFLAAKDNSTLYSGRDDLHTIDTSNGVMSFAFSSVGLDLRGCDFLNTAPPCFTNYGTGCPGTGGFTPQLGLTNCPVAGAGISINITNALGGANAVLFFGTMQSALPMGGGCFLNVQPLLPLTIPLSLSGAGAGIGSASVVGVVPILASGVTLTTQAFVLDPGGGLAGFTASNGLEMPFQ